MLPLPSLGIAAVLLLALATCALAQPAPSYKSLHYPPLGAVKIPKVEIDTLPNGIKIYLVEDHELPLIRGFALVRTGNLFDPKDKIGLATLTGTVMRSGGTRSKTGDQIDEALENIAANVETRIDESFAQVSFSTLKNSAPEVLATFRDVLTQPEFRAEKLELAKTQMRSGISRRNDDANGIAQREFVNLLYGHDTPYGWQIEYKTLDNIHRADLQAFYKRYFFPANTRIAIVGDFDPPEMRARIQQLFAGWTEKRDPVPSFPKVDSAAHPGTYLAVKTNVTQTNFMLGQIGGQLNDKDYPALEVMASILGGGFRSRLFRKVRSELGYAYNVFADWGANYDHPGLFLAGGSTKSASTTEAIQATLGELEKIRTKEVTKEELETAKGTVLNSFVFNFDTPSKTLNRLVSYDYYGYPNDFIYQYQKGVAAVTVADVLRVAREHIDPKKLSVVAVGNPKEFGAPLSKLDMPVTELDIAIPGMPENASPAATPGKTPAVTGDPATVALKLLQQLQTASGGADKLAAIKDFSQALSVQFEADAGGLKSTQMNLFVLPGAFRQENNLPFGKIIAFSDGKGGFVHSPQGRLPLNGPIATQIKGEIFRAYFNILLSDRDPKRTFVSNEADTIDISGAEGEMVQIKIDPATHLLASESYMQGQSVKLEFADYRSVDGVKLPFKVTIYQDGKKLGVGAVTEYKLNSGLKLEDLSK